MALQAPSFRRIFSRFFPKRYASLDMDLEILDVADLDQKKELAIRYLAQAELTLLQGNLHAIPLFQAAAELDGANPEVWYRQGLAFFEYGSEEGKEKYLLLASKYFKFTTQIAPNHFDAWVAWGNTLLQLGRFHEEHHFHLEAKEKYQKALELIEEQGGSILSELYWDYGIVWSEIAKYSGEALDLKCALDAFQASLKLQENPLAEFYNDYGNAYLEMGLLVNDIRLYLQAIHWLQKAVDAAPLYFDGWVSIAESYAQLYINTMDERYSFKAFQSYQAAVKLDPLDPEVWLSWAQILAESGKIKLDEKLLLQSIEKCARATSLDAEDPMITAQWVESLSLLGGATHRLDLLTEAEQKITKATESFPDDPDLWHAYGICLIAFGKYYEDPDFFEMAIDKLQYGLSIDRTIPEHWHTLGLAHRLYGDLTGHEDLLERANRFFAKAIDLKPSCPALLFDAASSLFRFSEMVGDLPSLQKAISLFEKLLQNYKSVVLHHPEWMFEYACSLEWLSEFTAEESQLTRATEIFSHLLLLEPGYPRIHYRLAHCYLELAHRTSEAEFYKKAIAFFRLSSKQDEENDVIWLDWGLCLIHLAQYTADSDFMDQLYCDAEHKILKAGMLGNPAASYHLACLYSILGRIDESMAFIQKALSARALPSLDEMLEDEWLDNLRDTELFGQFLTDLETKFQSREQ